MSRTSVYEHAHSRVLTPDGLNRSLRRISHEILERNASCLDRLALVGVLTRGVPLAQRISANVRQFEGLDLPVGSLDITLHRDDLQHDDPEVRGSSVPFDVTGKTVVLVDDVLYTGRTARAAMDALLELGRPPPFGWRSWSTAATGSCRFGPITSARTCLPRTAKGCLSTWRRPMGRTG